MKKLALMSLVLVLWAVGTARAFVCTEVLGFSQTGQWYLGPPVGTQVPVFEPLVGDAFWQLRAYMSAGLQWENPNFIGWNAGLCPRNTPSLTCALLSPCAGGPIDRELLTISVPKGVPTLAWWVTNIEATVATIRLKRPTVQQIVLQPVVGGPHHNVCYVSGSPVHASVIHPTIDRAISMVVGGDVIAGYSPEVTFCSDYADNTGHLKVAARPAIARRIAQYYLTH